MRLRPHALIAAAALGCRPEAPTPPEGMVYVPGGRVQVGSAHQGPLPPPDGGHQARARRAVELSPYFIDRTEVTRAAYAAFLLETGYRLPSVGEGWADHEWSWARPEEGLEREPDHPVVLVSWYDAVEFCRWRGARLPTDAEWELAALGADGRRYPWGDAWDPARLNHGQGAEPFFDDSDGWARTSPVGAYPTGASPWGLLDAFGNAWEWTADAWGEGWSGVVGEQTADGALRDPHTEGESLYRGVRGGSYYFDLLVNPDGERNGFLAELRRKTSGFRCAADVRGARHD